MWKVPKILGPVLTGVIAGTTSTLMTVHSNMANKKYVPDYDSCRFNFMSNNANKSSR
jgi:hypothetical protein